MNFTRTENRILNKCAVRGGPVTEVWNQAVGYIQDENGEDRETIISEVLDEAATAALPANMTPENKRRAAYVAETDPILAEEQGYRAEAEYWRQQGDTAKADAADAKAQERLRAYAAKKEEIRARHPDPTYSLTSSGTYHMLGCSYGSNGAALTLAEIAAQNPAANPCSRCNPPALPTGAANE